MSDLGYDFSDITEKGKELQDSVSDFFDKIEFPEFDWSGIEGPHSYILGAGSTAAQSISTTSVNGVSSTTRSLAISGNGNDTIFSLAGQSTIDAGGGVDVVVFTADRDDYQVQFTDVGVTITGAATRSTDNVISVERLQFADGTLALDVGSNAGQAYRIYQAAFDRTPDTPGLKYWVGILDQGNSLNYVADRFIDSDEFKSLYGADASNATFVDNLYRNILDRNGDEVGIAFWNEKLDSGELSRTDVLVRFSESDENIVGVAPSINDGIWLG